MKKGKTSQLKILNNAKCYYGTVDALELKSVYVVLQTWAQPKQDHEKWDRVTSSIKRNIKFTLNEVCKDNIFESHYIVDLDLRSSGLQVGKRSFMNLEITLFLKESCDFKSPILRKKIKHLITSVYHENIMTTKYFDIYRTKKTKELT